MGYGGRRGGGGVHIHIGGGRRHRGFHHRRHRRRRVTYLHWGPRRRRYHYYGTHHVYHTRAYYAGAETQAQPPPQPPYVVIYETRSQFQTIKIVEFTSQPMQGATTVQTAQGVQPVQVMTQQGQAVMMVQQQPQPSAPMAVGQPLMSTTATAPQQVQMQQVQQPMQATMQPMQAQQVQQPIQQMQVQPQMMQMQQPQVGTVGAFGQVQQVGQPVQMVPMVVVQQAPQQVQGQRQRGLVLENEIQFSTLDEADYHNVLVHSGMDALLASGRNEMLRVLIIGGGDCICIRELVKYDAQIITEITMVEIDQMVVDTCKQYFPEFTEGLKDMRVRVIYSDANIWVKQQIDARMLNNYDLVICDLTEDGTLSQPLVNPDFWNNLSQMLKTNINGQIEGLIVRNGYHKPKIIRNGNDDDVVLQNAYYISTYLPTFGGNYVFTMLSHGEMFGNITDFANADNAIREKNGGKNIATRMGIANANELMYSYNWYFYNPEPEDPWYVTYSGWIVLLVIIIIIVIIIVVA